MTKTFNVTHPKVSRIPTVISTARPAAPTFFVIASLVFAASLAACVTVNVNFPESAVQEATDDYVRDIYRTKEQGKSPTAKPSPHSGASAGATSSSSALSFSMIASSYADVSFNLTSAKTESIKGKMKARVPEIIEQKRAGVLGETKSGLLTIRDASKLKPLLKKRVEDFVKEENNDRDGLYAEIVQANHLGSNNLNSVQASFARSFQSESPSGTWVESPSGAWSQKP